MDKNYPRVTAAQIPSFRGQHVLVVGRVIQSSSGKAVLEASDKGKVNVKTFKEQNFTDGVVEVVGRVFDDLTVEEHSSMNYGENFDMKTYLHAIEMAKKFPQIF